MQPVDAETSSPVLPRSGLGLTVKQAPPARRPKRDYGSLGGPRRGKRYGFSEIKFLRKYEIFREKLRQIEEYQNNLKKFEKMKFLAKLARLRSEMRVTAVRYTRTWSRIFSRRYHAVRTFSRAFYNCVSHGHHAIIHGTRFKTRRLT